ncbi:uncharacterized protein LOC124890347, partial [Capsicum annuum]|uniref:uncharacterized protein LOC124890347 n=1 Tax=Capsicum annuum TaxID=4072 RepID=UPI001FB11FFE
MVTTTYECTVWRAIRNLWPLMQTRTRFKTKQATIAEMRNGQAWNRRYLYDWEMETIASFYANLADFTSSVEKVDRLEWQKDKSGKFTVNSAYKDLNISEFQEKDWPWKMIWKIKISNKAETVNHLFLHCKWTDQLWKMFISLRKFSLVRPRNIKGFLNAGT